MKAAKRYLPFLITALTTIILFLPYFTKGLIPFPGDFQIAWFEPWKSQFSSGSTLAIAHKPIADDVFRQLYPFKILSMEMVKSGYFPLWNFYNGSGMPLLATMHVGYLNPFNILFLIINHIQAWAIYIIIQPFFIGIFTYLYCQKINLQKFSSLFASICFILSGFVVNRTIFGDYDYAVLGMVALLYLTEAFFCNEGKALFIPLAVFLIITSTQPQIILYLLTFTIIYSFIRYKNNTYKAPLIKLFLLYIVGIGLAAVQLLPTLELFKYSAISTSSSKFIIDRFLLPPQHFISFIIPNYFGNQATYNYWGSADYIETIGTIGSIPILFGVLSKANKENTIKYFYYGVIIFSILFSLDWPLSRLVFSLPIPLISTNIPSRIFMLSTFSFSILAGMGFEIIQARKVSVSKFLKNSLGYNLLLSGIFLGTLVFYKLQVNCTNEFIKNCRSIALRNTLFELITYILGISIIVIYLKSKKYYPRTFFIIIMVIVISLGLYNSYKYLPFTTTARVMPNNNIINFLQKNTIPDRVLGLGNANIKTDFATAYKFYDPNYYDPLYLKRYGELVNFAKYGNLSHPLLRSDIELSNEPNISPRESALLNLLDVKYLIVKKSDNPTTFPADKMVYEDKDWKIVINQEALPLLHFVKKVEVVQKSLVLEKLFNKDFNSNNTALVSEPLKITTSTQTSVIPNVTYSPNQIATHIYLNSQGFMVLSENYYPGWHAYIDEEETKIYQTNYTFQGIMVPAGNHTVTFKYFPSSVVVGLYISIASIIVWLFLFLREKISS